MASKNVQMLAGGGPKWSRLDSLTIGKRKEKRLRKSTVNIEKKTTKKKRSGSPFRIIGDTLRK
jgi:hypothetical protein